jgi:hypothetical protein
METTLFLAKVIGLYFLVIGLHMALRGKELRLMFEAFAENRPLTYLASVFALILGLLLVVSHNVWVAGWPVIVTLLSWLVLIKAIAYLLLPFSAMAGVVKAFNRPAWFTAGGAITAGFGVFLAAKGFQIF